MAAPSPFAQTVRAHDWPRYIATQFAPEAKRSDLLVLYAFDAEISRITRTASDPLPGEIRLQWWREVLSGERAGEAAGHPLAMALVDVVTRHSLPRTAFDGFLEAQTFAFYHDAFPDTVSFEGWCGQTQSALLQLAALILDADGAAAAAEASGHGGVALGISHILANLPQTRARGQCYLPQDLLTACGLSREAFVAGQDNQAMACAVKAFAELGISHFAKFRTHAKGLPKQVRPALLAVATAKPHLKRCAANPQSGNQAQITPLRQFAAILHAALG